MKKLIVLLGLLTLSSPVLAICDDVVLNLASHHLSATKQYNEFNKGLGCAWETKWKYIGEVEPQFGGYNNSDADWVAYVSLTKFLVETHHKYVRVRYGLMGGLVYGYEATPLLPIGAGIIGFHPTTLGKLNEGRINFLIAGYRDQDEKIKPLFGLQLHLPIK